MYAFYMSLYVHLTEAIWIDVNEQQSKQRKDIVDNK